MIASISEWLATDEAAWKHSPEWRSVRRAFKGDGHQTQTNSGTANAFGMLPLLRGKIPQRRRGGTLAEAESSDSRVNSTGDLWEKVGQNLQEFLKENLTAAATSKELGSPAEAELSTCQSDHPDSLGTTKTFLFRIHCGSLKWLVHNLSSKVQSFTILRATEHAHMEHAR